MCMTVYQNEGHLTLNACSAYAMIIPFVRKRWSGSLCCEEINWSASVCACMHVYIYANEGLYASSNAHTHAYMDTSIQLHTIDMCAEIRQLLPTCCARTNGEIWYSLLLLLPHTQHVLELSSFSQGDKTSQTADFTNSNSRAHSLI